MIKLTSNNRQNHKYQRYSAGSFMKALVSITNRFNMFYKFRTRYLLILLSQKILSNGIINYPYQRIIDSSNHFLFSIIVLIFIYFITIEENHICRFILICSSQITSFRPFQPLKNKRRITLLPRDNFSRFLKSFSFNPKQRFLNQKKKR